MTDKTSLTMKSNRQLLWNRKYNRRERGWSYFALEENDILWNMNELAVNMTIYTIKMSSFVECRLFRNFQFISLSWLLFFENKSTLNNDMTASRTELVVT